MTRRFRLCVFHCAALALLALALPVGAQQGPGKSSLEELAELPGVTGNEEQVTGYIADRLRRLKLRGGNLEVEVDNLGNVVARLGVGAPHRLIITSIDEPGYFVSAITDDGYLRLQSLPQFGLHPWFHLLHANQPVQILSRRGRLVNGIFAGLSTHLQGGRVNPEDLVVDHLDEVYVDVGAKSAAEARLAGADILDPVTLEKQAYRLANDEITAPFIGSRAGAATLIGLFERMNASNLRGTLTIAFVTRRYMGNQGLARMLNRFTADEVVLLQPLRGDEARPGDGVQVAAFRGRDGENVALRDELLANSSHAKAGPAQRAPRIRYFGAAQLPARSAVVSVPVRFPQTPIETVSSADIKDTATLLGKWVGTDLPGKEHETITVTTVDYDRPVSKTPAIGGLLRILVETYGVSGYEEPVATAPADAFARETAEFLGHGHGLAGFDAEGGDFFRRARSGVGDIAMTTAHRHEFFRLVIFRATSF